MSDSQQLDEPTGASDTDAALGELRPQQLRRQIIASIKRSAAMHGQPLSIYTYLNFKQPEDPGMFMVERQYRNWAEACRDAHVDPA